MKHLLILFLLPFLFSVSLFAGDGDKGKKKGKSNNGNGNSSVAISYESLKGEGWIFHSLNCGDVVVKGEAVEEYLDSHLYFRTLDGKEVAVFHYVNTEDVTCYESSLLGNSGKLRLKEKGAVRVMDIVSLSANRLELRHKKRGEDVVIVWVR